MRNGQSLTAALAGVALLASTGCSGFGNVLGGVFNSGRQEEGTIQGVDTRSQQLFLRQDDDRIIAITYDSRTEVHYQDQTYPASSLDPGDEVTIRVQDGADGSLYATRVEVTRPSTTGGGGDLVTVQGTVRSVDTQRGMFSMTRNNQVITVSLPYNARAGDVDRLRDLRIGQTVRVQGTWLTDTRLELWQFQ